MTSSRFQIKRRFTDEVLFECELPAEVAAQSVGRQMGYAIREVLLTRADLTGADLDMSQWHACETTHCRAGWAITLAGEVGQRLERKHGPAIAGRMIYLASTGRAPHFFASTERAMEDIRACAAEQETAQP